MYQILFSSRKEDLVGFELNYCVHSPLDVFLVSDMFVSLPSHQIENREEDERRAQFLRIF